jgi:murein DD-endopeptidase MepM/ murein hydrolase activator NlpD
VPPVNGAVAFPYVEPSCEFCAGHRTIDFEQSVGRDVISPVAGRITFAGTVVDQQFVSIDPGPESGFGPEVVVTIGGLIRGPKVTSGQVVQAGQRLGTTDGLIHLSMRYISEGKPARYVDPTPFLARRRSRVRLIPNSRTGGRRSQSQLSCPGSFGR